MLFFHYQRLVFLEVPKTGSSAVVSALKEHASMVVQRPPQLRHMNAGTFNRDTRRYIEATWGHRVESFATMRDPVDRLVSWYRYLQREPDPNGPESTIGVGFEDFVASVLGNEGPFGWIGRQDRFLMGNGKDLLVDHLFQYDDPDPLLKFLSRRFKREIRFDRVNVSAAEPVAVPDALREQVFKARPREARLWKKLVRKGHLRPSDM